VLLASTAATGSPHEYVLAVPTLADMLSAAAPLAGSVLTAPACAGVQGAAAADVLCSYSAASGASNADCGLRQWYSQVESHLQLHIVLETTGGTALRYLSSSEVDSRRRRIWMSSVPDSELRFSSVWCSRANHADVSVTRRVGRVPQLQICTALLAADPDSGCTFTGGIQKFQLVRMMMTVPPAWGASAALLAAAMSQAASPQLYCMASHCQCRVGSAHHDDRRRLTYLLQSAADRSESDPRLCPESAVLWHLGEWFENL